MLNYLPISLFVLVMSLDDKKNWDTDLDHAKPEEEVDREGRIPDSDFQRVLRKDTIGMKTAMMALLVNAFKDEDCESDYADNKLVELIERAEEKNRVMAETGMEKLGSIVSIVGHMAQEVDSALRGSLD